MCVIKLDYRMAERVTDRSLGSACHSCMHVMTHLRDDVYAVDVNRPGVGRVDLEVDVVLGPDERPVVGPRSRHGKCHRQDAEHA